MRRLKRATARQQARERERLEQLRELLRAGTEDHYLDPVLYDFEYREQENDIDWYREFVSQRADGRALIELGAGTGRVTIPLAEDGHEVIALDRMPSMLDALVDKLDRSDPEVAARIEPVLGDMCEIPFEDETVGIVIAPFNALMHLYDWEQLLACFREVHRVLEPDGLFAFDVLLPDIDWLNLDENARHCVTRFTHPVTKEKLVYSTNHTYDHDTQVCHIRIFYDDAPARGRKFRATKTPRELVHLAHRQIFPQELRLLAHTTGFELESLTGDFLGLTLNADVESQVAVARKPKP